MHPGHSLHWFFVAASLWLVGPAHAKKVTFRFSMPARVSYVQTLTATKTKNLGSGAKTTDVTVTKTKVTIGRKAKGYVLVARPLSMSMRRNGKKVEHPLFKILAKLRVTYQIDRDGRIQSVSGFDDLHQRMKASMPPRLFEMLAAVVTPEAMKTKEIALWNGRVGDFVGKSFTIGQAVPSLSKLQLPGVGAISFLVATKVANKARCKPGGCVRVAFKYGSRPKAFIGFASGIVKKLSKLVDPSGRKKMEISGPATIEGDGYRIIDPSTMLIYKEVNRRTIKMVMAVPGRGKVPSVVSETRVHTFVY